MRAIVYGTTGSGKSTFASALAAAQDVDFIELDLINWLPNWTDRQKVDFDGFRSDIGARIALENWVATGSYGSVRQMMWSRATDLIWLDLPRWQVMQQVIKRSFQRAASGKDVFPGCRETWARMLNPEHPIPWAWTTYHRRRTNALALLAKPENSHLIVHRCRSRGEVAETLARLSAASGRVHPRVHLSS